MMVRALRGGRCVAPARPVDFHREAYVNVSVLIPWRTDHAHRAQVFAHVRERWAELPVQVVIGQDAGPADAPFNVSRAFNDAARHATGDVFVLFGADQLPDLDAVYAAAAYALEHDSWAPLFANTGAYREIDTGLIVHHGADPARYDFAQWAPFCTGILAVTRRVWEDIGGMDERFFGWGVEDAALRLVLGNLHPSGYEPTGTLRCLWHPAAPRDRFEANSALMGEYIAAVDSGRLREYVDNLKAGARRA
jgi:hypothetical protein